MQIAKFLFPRLSAEARAMLSDALGVLALFVLTYGALQFPAFA